MFKVIYLEMVELELEFKNFDFYVCSLRTQQSETLDFQVMVEKHGKHFLKVLEQISARVIKKKTIFFFPYFNN